MSTSSKNPRHNLSATQLAKLSDTSYQEVNATKRAWLKTIDKNLRLDHQLTNKHTSVVRDIRNDNVYVNFRGTKLDDLSDLSADLAIITGKEDLHKRWADADKHFQKVRNTYGDKANYIITGHSLGGALGASVAKKYDIESHLFNAGSSVLNVRSNSKKEPEPVKERKNKITHYTTGKDLISLGAAIDPSFADETKNVGCKTNKINCHSLSHFLDRDDI